jgi:hypothetical protein
LQATNLARDGDILSRARTAALDILAQDPSLCHSDHLPLRDTVHRRWQQKLALGDVA